MATGSGTGTPTSSTEIYGTNADLKARLDISGSTEDDFLDFLLEVASRAIDDWCHRQFYVSTGATRYFDTQGSQELLIDDILSLTTLTTDSEADGTFDGETWTQGVANDFYLWPLNRTPKMKVVVAAAGDYSFAVNQKNYVKIVGNWGYASETPPRIENACLLLAAQEYEGQGGENYQSEGIGDYRYRVSTGIDRNDQLMRILGPFRKLI